MSTILPKESKGDFTPAPAGTHVAVCYGVVDLGTQGRTYKGEMKIAPEILLMFELSNEMMENHQPFTISQRFTLKSGGGAKKSKLREFLEAWRGVPFTPEEFGNFDVANLLGKGCMLNVIHNKVNDKIYANIASVMRLLKGVEAPAPFNPLVHFTFDHFDERAYNSLTQYWREKIAESPEYKELKGIGHGEEDHYDEPPVEAYSDAPF